ncbi:TonB-dependent receptor plug domain-containing protein [Thalassotalea sp. 1_MG-2023]|uniref:TonB-dependent receptor plug domain-containing protein n=1 Tax=Thalassotalea sp. 1_MG-2023 TaxID=3062680 RepID=UPI0026E37009|nr:TonB-dependent receptor plug domain-containing protein [Thalassotalea sp. 1_MG-2023]MDO6427515.1 TonB-dependent receptor plug domain-containing protein [Thalassotalea sp. 1_MG-2023]
MTNHYKLQKLAVAVGLGLFSVTGYALAPEEEQVMEEVVAKATRLQGSAASVIAERKNQAFVADILGSEQMSRTGDSDAASALRRVTGLTLVDGKFIYVRGLGERYSSARLNGATIPSPDLTRNVVPLDIIPSSIIESMAVQKAFSANMPAAFGGGSIDIRTKSVPSQFTSSIEVGIGYDSSADDGFTYERPSGNIPKKLEDAIVQYRGNFSIDNIIKRDGITASETQTVSEIAVATNNELLKALPRDLTIKEQSLDPKYDIKAHIGNSIDETYFGGTIGFLAAFSYESQWDSADKSTNIVSQNLTDNCSTSLGTAEDIAASCYTTIKNSSVTTETERYNGVLNFGYKLNNHSISFNNLYLVDNEDEVEVGEIQSPGGSNIYTIVNDGRADRLHQFKYEERTLLVNQVIGQHTFVDYWGIGADWQYTESEANTEIPLDASYRFIDRFEDGVYASSSITGDDNRAVYNYTDMEDHVKSYGGNITLPIYNEGYELELKAGYDFSDRGRFYTTSSYTVDNDSGSSITINDGSHSPLNNANYLTDAFIEEQRILVDFNEPSAPDADDYLAAQKIDAVYGSFDFIYGDLRFSGGVRYEEFKQTSIGTSSLIFGKKELDIYYAPEKIEAGSINDDDLYPSLAFTYSGSERYQIRASYGETVVRPDLREVVPVAYFDPLTDFRTFGRVSLQSSPMKNYDLRYEYYADNGDNFTVAAFYKDISSPIEKVLTANDASYNATFVNGEIAEVTGVEVEWMHDLTYLADGFFTSGNITLSDSEVSIDPALAGNLTNPTKRMTGHSEYVVNFQLNYDSANGNHSGALVYNVFGERIVASGLGGSEDAMEQPFHAVDLVYTYYPDFNSKVKLKVKNLLDESQEVTQSDIAVREKEIGTSVSLSYTYEF